MEIDSTVAAILDKGGKPLVVGGDCTVLVGALAAAKEQLGRVGLAFVDGHLDLFSGETPPRVRRPIWIWRSSPGTVRQDWWDGQTKEALAHLQEARTLAEEIGLPGELWQIWAALGELHEQRGETEEAHGAFSRAARIAERLAGEIDDDTLEEGFLSAPQPRRVMETSARKL